MLNEVQNEIHEMEKREEYDALLRENKSLKEELEAYKKEASETTSLITVKNGCVILSRDIRICHQDGYTLQDIQDTIIKLTDALDKLRYLVD